MNNKNIYILSFFWLAIIVISCNKTNYLDAKPDQKLVIPTKLSDYQALLDNEYMVNNIVPSLGETAGDDYYLTPRGFSAISDVRNKNLYLWEDDIWYGSTNNNWNIPYGAIFYANTVLTGIEKLKEGTYDKITFNHLKGAAFFVRAHSIFQLAQVFSPCFDVAVNQEYGVPYRGQADINEAIKRVSVHENYEGILRELKDAKDLLPETPEFITRPSKAAALGLLARVYISMRIYDSAYKYSNECLQLKNKLVNYNELNSLVPFPFPIHNAEVIWPSAFATIPNILPAFQTSRQAVDGNLISLYSDIDLRKSLYYGNNTDGSKYFRGSYNGTGSFFAGIAVDEVFLIRAECFARAGKIIEAMADINTLLAKRYNDDFPYIPLTATNTDEALSIVLRERRKELVFRGLRWMDLRRYSKSGQDIQLKRVVNDQPVLFDMSSPRNTFLIPPDVMSFHPEMLQNPR